jgi:hypothetical protein
MELWQFLLTLLFGGGVGGGGVFGWLAMRDQNRAKANKFQADADLVLADVRRKDADTASSETDATIRRLREYIRLMDEEHTGDKTAHLKLHDDWLAAREELSRERANAAWLEKEGARKDEELSRKQARINGLEERVVALEKQLAAGVCKWENKSA